MSKFGKEKKIFFGVPDLGREEIKAVTEVIKSKWLGFGKVSLEFEESLARYLGVKYASVLSSCTAALHLALVANKVEPGDEIITTSLTFAATANVICYMGAKPVFVDINPKTFNIDETLIEKAITKKTRGIMPVHFGGLPCDMAAINAVARKHGLFVVEDAAHAIGATYRGKKIGNSDNAVCFSFYPNKSLSTPDGGLICSNKKSLIEPTRITRLFGLDKSAWKRFKADEIVTTETVDLGYKYSITDVHSAFGIIQLGKLEKNLTKREEYARLYDKAFSEIDGITLQEKFGKDFRHAQYLYLLVIDPEKFSASRDKLVLALRQKGIFAVVHYKPLHLHKFYCKVCGCRAGSLPITEKIGNNILTLPLLPQESLATARWVAETTKNTLLEFKK